MRILFLTPQLPYPPRQGTAIRNYNLIRNLGLNHSLDLLTFLAPGDSLAPDSPLLGLCDNLFSVPQPQRTTRQRLLTTFTSLKPDMGLRLHSAEMFEQVKQLPLHSYDIIHIEGIEMAPYALQLAKTLHNTGALHRQQPETIRHRPSIVFDDHNCEYLLQKRNALTDLRIPKRWIAAGYSIVQWQKLRMYERRTCKAADLVVAVSEPDRQALSQLTSSQEIILVPNGIDTSSYANVVGKVRQGTNIVFTGKMDYRPNIDAVLWFGKQVFPLIQAHAPTAKFQIVGQQPHSRLDILRDNPDIQITGAVPEILPYMENAAIFVIPMRIGGGTRLKALEAMAAGLPIVSTTLGIEGIPVRNGRELLIRDDPREFADAVLMLLADQRGDMDASKLLGNNARTFVVENYEWSSIVPVLEQALLELTDRLNSHSLGRT